MIVRNESRSTVLAEHVEVGSSFWAKFRGLMGRRSLPAGHALWLPGDNGIHMFFMRFPIDAVFVGRPTPGIAGGGLRTVLSVHRALAPWTGIVPLVRGADGVVELPVGAIDASRTEPGDLLFIG
jgi:uncharacterized membrane protein (UPF0127 family)